MALAIHEVLEKTAAKRHKADKIQFLQSNESWALKDVLRVTYDEKIRWNLPVGSTPYQASQEHNHPASLTREHQKFKYFLVNGPDMPKFKREKLYIGLLEGVHPKDAEIVVNMTNKKPIDGISKPIVQEAFPGVIKDQD